MIEPTIIGEIDEAIDGIIGCGCCTYTDDAKRLLGIDEQDYDLNYVDVIKRLVKLQDQVNLMKHNLEAIDQELRTPMFLGRDGGERR